MELHNKHLLTMKPWLVELKPMDQVHLVSFITSLLLVEYVVLVLHCKPLEMLKLEPVE